jgi:hypothetical protein
MFITSHCVLSIFTSLCVGNIGFIVLKNDKSMFTIRRDQDRQIGFRGCFLLDRKFQDFTEENHLKLANSNDDFNLTFNISLPDLSELTVHSNDSPKCLGVGFGVIDKNNKPLLGWSFETVSMSDNSIRGYLIYYERQNGRLNVFKKKRLDGAASNVKLSLIKKKNKVSFYYSMGDEKILYSSKDIEFTADHVALGLFGNVQETSFFKVQKIEMER